MTIWLLVFTLLFGLVVTWLVVGFRSKRHRPYGIEGFSTRGSLYADTSPLLSPPVADSDAAVAAMILDTETTGLLPEEFDQYINEEKIVAVVKLAWMLVDEEERMISQGVHLLNQNVDIPPEAEEIHRISNEEMHKEGKNPKEVYSAFLTTLPLCPLIVAHNASFHIQVLISDIERYGLDATILREKPFYCTMINGIDITSLTDQRGRWKSPKLGELFAKIYFNLPRISIDYHDKALADIRLVRACYSLLRGKDVRK